LEKLPVSDWEDEKAIRELLSAYCFCVDRAHADAFVELFTEDGVWDRGRFGRVEGRRALHDYLSAAARGADKAKTRHFSSNELVTITRDTAAARSYVLVMDAAPTPPVALVIGYYEDQFVKMDGRWRFKSRCLRGSP
jgi:SnoaL-like domain